MRKPKSILLLLFALFALSNSATAQEPKNVIASTGGTGKIKIGKEQFKLDAVVVKLFEDGKAEINLISDITIFIQGTWSRPAGDDKSLDLKVTGNMTAGGLDGTGKILLTEDRKGIAGLKLQVLNKITKRSYVADFAAK